MLKGFDHDRRRYPQSDPREGLPSFAAELMNHGGRQHQDAAELLRAQDMREAEQSVEERARMGVEREQDPGFHERVAGSSPAALRRAHGSDPQNANPALT
jgi:hypothetical protein